MSSSPIEELVIAYDPSRVVERVQRRRRLVRSRLFSLGISVVVVIGFSIWLGARGLTIGAIWLSVVFVLVGVAWVLVYLVGYLRARRELEELGTGTAVRIGRTGVEIGGAAATWTEVVAIRAVKGSLGGRPRLELARTNGAPGQVSFDQIDVRPATLDSVARAYSSGRHGVDLAALDA